MKRVATDQNGTTAGSATCINNSFFNKADMIAKNLNHTTGTFTPRGLNTATDESGSFGSLYRNAAAFDAIGSGNTARFK